MAVPCLPVAKRVRYSQYVACTVGFPSRSRSTASHRLPRVNTLSPVPHYGPAFPSIRITAPGSERSSMAFSPAK